MYIVKHRVAGRERYLVWSTVVDAPVTYGLSLRQLRIFWRGEYGRVGLESLDSDLARGHRVMSVASIARGPSNRAGAEETSLSVAQIVDYYFVRRGRGPQPCGK